MLLLNNENPDKSIKKIYRKNVRISTDKRLVLIKLNKKGKISKIQNIKSNYVLRKSGNYEIIYDDSEMIYFEIRKRKFLLIIIIFFLLGFMFYKTRLPNNNTYVFNSSIFKVQDIFLLDSSSKILKHKIAPGSKGDFIITIIGEKKKFLYKEKNNKPYGIKFVLNNKEYDSLKELMDDINILIDNDCKNFHIFWYWNYENDAKDTYDGINTDKYSFELIY